MLLFAGKSVCIAIVVFFGEILHYLMCKYLFSLCPLFPFCADNGGGMNIDTIRHCMSFGYSAKSKMANTIGQCKCAYAAKWEIYKQCHIFHLFCSFLDGNGFKTSTMRIGADVIVFSRCLGKDGKRLRLLLTFQLTTIIMLDCSR